MLSPGLNCVSLDLCKDINLDLDTRFNPDESAPSLLYWHMRQSINTYTIPSVCADSHAIFMHIQARMLSWALSYISFLYHIALIDHTVKSQAPVSISVNNLLYNHVDYVLIVQSFNLVVHSHPIVIVMVVIVIFDSCNECKVGYIVWWSTVSYTCHISFNVAICDSSTKAWMVPHYADYPSRDWEPGETDRLVEFMHIIPRCMQQQFFSEPTNRCWYVQSYCSYQSKHLCIGHTKFPTWLQQHDHNEEYNSLVHSWCNLRSETNL